MRHYSLISCLRTLMGILFVCSIHTQLFSQWTLQYYDTTYLLRDINFISPNTGVAVGEKFDYSNNYYRGVILRTSNGGNNWNTVFMDTLVYLWSSHFTSDMTGFAVGGFYSEGPKMLKTTNGGENWYYISTGNISSSINSIIFFNQIGFATTMGGVFKSINGGINWFRVLGNFSLYACSYFLNENTGWCFYDYGFAYKTSNGGMSWDTNYMSYRYPHKVQFLNSNTGFFICDTSEQYYYHNQILKTTNGGVNWSILNFGLNNHHWSLHFVDENTGYACGSGGEVIKSTDAGNTWSISWTGVPFSSLFEIYFLNAYTGYACGSSSVIIKTTCGGFIGISAISNQIPKEFMLYQNYPNPFNPSTKIKFAVTKSSNIKIVIYDLNGREIETLVNENVNPGIYEVSWDASKFSSGIYFYRLLTNEYTSVKKMALIK